jgi:hypothetical protein
VGQEQFAGMLGITRTYLSQIENGRAPSENILARLTVLERTGPYTADMPLASSILSEAGAEATPAFIIAPDDAMSPEIQPGDKLHLGSAEPSRGALAVVQLQDGRTIVRRWYPVDRVRVSLRADNTAYDSTQLGPGEYNWARPVWQLTRKY